MAPESVLPNVEVRKAVAFQVRRNHLACPADSGGITSLVSDLCGVQSQVLTSAEQAICVRLKGVHEGDLTKALEVERTLVRSWLMRGTVHTVPSPELPLFCAALAEDGIRELHRWLGSHGVDSAQINRGSEHQTVDPTEMPIQGRLRDPGPAGNRFDRYRVDSFLGEDLGGCPK